MSSRLTFSEANIRLGLCVTYLEAADSPAQSCDSICFGSFVKRDETMPFGLPLLLAGDVIDNVRTAHIHNGQGAIDVSDCQKT